MISTTTVLVAISTAPIFLWISSGTLPSGPLSEKARKIWIAEQNAPLPTSYMVTAVDKDGVLRKRVKIDSHGRITWRGVKTAAEALRLVMETEKAIGDQRRAR